MKKERTLQPGEELYRRRFRIIGTLGKQDTRSKVYLAKDVVGGESVVLKLGEAHETGAPYRMYEYLNTAEKSPHGIVGVRDILPETSKEPWCVVQAFVDTEDLAVLLERSLVVPLTALQIAADIADGLICFHEQGIAHCDIKPCEIKTGGDGRAILVDWSKARLMGSEAEPQMAAWCRAPYSPVELVRGGKADDRVDVFSLAMMLLHLLTGKPDFNPRARPYPEPDVIASYVEDRLERVLRPVRDPMRIALSQASDRRPGMSDFRASIEQLLVEMSASSIASRTQAAAHLASDTPTHLSEGKLKGEQIEKLQEAILGAFTPDQFRQFLLTSLDRDLSHISMGGNMTTVAFDVITEAERGGWMVKLLDAVAEARPDRKDLQPLFAELCAVVESPTQQSGGLAPQAGLTSAKRASLERQLAAQRENLLLIEDRMNEFVLSSDIPLQLVKSKRETEARIAELEAKLGLTSDA